jgi:hypothetical protein
MIIDRTRARRTALFIAAFILLPPSAIALVLCIDSYTAWLQFRLAADEHVSPQLEWLRSALTAGEGRKMS